MAEINENIIETVTEDGEKVKFEIFEIIEFEEKEYALLTPVESDETEEDDLVLMRLLQEDDEYVFETIDDDDEFDRVSEYLEELGEEE